MRLTVLFVVLCTIVNLVASDRLIIKYSRSKTGLNKIMSMTDCEGKNLRRMFFPKDMSVPAAYELEKYYIVDYDSKEKAKSVREKLVRQDGVISVEMDDPHEANYTPNDPYIGNQHYLPQIQAFQAWDFTTGDKTIVVGIVDSGVEWDHPDLADNIYINELEIADNGIDDDDNGYKDDYMGWDFVNIPQSTLESYKEEGYQIVEGEDYSQQDNDPMDINGHGSHCAGLASAATDNEVGIAGIGFNCKIMPLRIGFTVIKPDGSQSGIGFASDMAKAFVYAADNGADVVNLSYGNSGSAIQDAAQYCYEKGVAVFTSAGNDNTENSTASLDNTPYAISVAALDSTDRRSNYSNFGDWVEISAPGGNHRPGLYSTVPRHSYEYYSGTSMASPVAAGCYALMKSAFPDLSVDELIARLYYTSDPIDHRNPGYEGKLGIGRVNAYRAVSETAHPYLSSCEAALEQVTGNDNNVIEGGETFSLSFEVMNEWEINNNTTIKINCNDPFIEFDEEEIVATINPYQYNNTQAFNFTVAPSVPYHEVTIGVTFDFEGIYEQSFQVNMELGTPNVAVLYEDSSSSDLTVLESLARSNDLTFKKLYNENVTKEDLASYSLIFVAKSDTAYYHSMDMLKLLPLSGGGHVVLSGSGIKDRVDADAELKEWYENFSGAILAGNYKINEKLSGLELDPITDGMSIKLNGGFVSVFSNLSETSSPLFLNEIQDTVGVYSFQEGAYRINMGFNWNNLNDGERAELFSNIISETSAAIKISHKEAPDREITSEDIEINVLSAVDESLVIKLYWKLREETDFNEVVMNPVETGYRSLIPAPNAEVDMDYYIYAEKEGRVRILPSTYPETYTVSTYPDTTFPEYLEFVPHPEYSFKNNNYKLKFKVKDNQGVNLDSSVVRYKKLGGSFVTAPFTSLGNDEYETEIVLEEGLLLDEKVIYWLETQDNSEKGNMKRFPSGGALFINYSDSVVVDDFEGDYSEDYWDFQGDWGLFGSYAYDGDYILKYPNEGKPYDDNRNDCATYLIPYDLTQFDNMTLTFAHKLILPLNTEGDTAFVEVSVNNKESWTTVEYFAERETQYSVVQISLDDYCNENDSVYIRFRFSSNDDGKIGFGWFLDNVNLINRECVGIGEKSDVFKKGIVFEQNYPNPFNPTTLIRYGIPKASHVSLEVYNMIGQKTRTLFVGKQSEGVYACSWDGKNDNGKSVSSGIYFGVLTINKKERYVKKMTLLK